MIVLCMLNLYIYILNLFNNIDRTAYYEVIGYLLSQFEFYVFLLLRDVINNTCSSTSVCKMIFNTCISSSLFRFTLDEIFY